MSRSFKLGPATGRSLAVMTTGSATTRISDLLAAAADQAVPVVRGIGDDQFAAPTPCAGYDVRDLLNHLFHMVVGFTVRAAKQDFDFTTTPDRLQPNWRDRFAQETGRLVRAWAAPGAEEGESGPMRMPASTVGRLILLDLTVHPWDLARATGQEFAPAGACVRDLLPHVTQTAPMARQWKVFGEPVPVPAGASEFARLLGLTGRDPHWRPPR